MNLSTRIEIATIAAILMRDGASPIDACRKALELLDIANFAAGAMSAADGFTDAGIDQWAERQVAVVQRKILEMKTPKFNFPASGLLPWGELEKHLEPREKRVEKIPRFKRWLSRVENIDTLQAGERVAEFKQDGVPEHIVGY